MDNETNPICASVMKLHNILENAEKNFLDAAYAAIREYIFANGKKISKEETVLDCTKYAEFQDSFDIELEMGMDSDSDSIYVTKISVDNNFNPDSWSHGITLTSEDGYDWSISQLKNYSIAALVETLFKLKEEEDDGQ